jgi:hypothetical protein
VAEALRTTGENGRYFVEKVHIYKESYWNSWKPAETYIISSD